MLSEPYIIVSGPSAGKLISISSDGKSNVSGALPNDKAVPYADFEREKLRELDSIDGIEVGELGYAIYLRGFAKGHVYSEDCIKYDQQAYDRDSESSRLLRRAEFLKTVCEKEGVEWLPECRCVNCSPHVVKDGEAFLTNGCLCPCSCHKPNEEPSLYGKGTSELEADLRHIYISLAIADLKKDMYTKAEIDERMTAVADLFDDTLDLELRAKNIASFRSRFL